MLDRPWQLQALAEKGKASSGVSLHTQSLALVYDPELENPKGGERTPRRDPALRRAALSFYADMSDMRCDPAVLCPPIPDLLWHQEGTGSFHATRAAVGSCLAQEASLKLQGAAQSDASSRVAWPMCMPCSSRLSLLRTRGLAGHSWHRPGPAQGLCSAS